MHHCIDPLILHKRIINIAVKHRDFMSSKVGLQVFSSSTVYEVVTNVGGLPRGSTEDEA